MLNGQKYGAISQMISSIKSDNNEIGGQECLSVRQWPGRLGVQYHIES